MSPGKRDQEMEREQRRRERLEKEFKEISIKFNQKVHHTHACSFNRHVRHARQAGPSGLYVNGFVSL